MSYYLMYQKILDADGNFIGINGQPVVIDQEEMDEGWEDMENFLIIELTEASELQKTVTETIN